MKKITLSLLVVLLSFLGFSQEVRKAPMHFGRTISAENISPSGHIRCISTEYEAWLQEQDPKRLNNQQFEDWIAPLIEKYEQEQMVSSQSGGIIYIPVVVHVIHNGDAYGANENITDEQVASQITVMTQDFRKMVGTPGYNTNPVGADTTIEFVLAKVDPNGNPTNGIDRVNMCETSWSTTDINGTVKPATIWDPTQYMNMWSVNFTDSSLLGYAQFPSNSGLGGLNASGGAANTDGVVAGYRYFGSSSLASGNFSPPFDKGRTMTHEVGHFLGLRHIWGDSTCGNDFCADTPQSTTANYGCPTQTTCDGVQDMVQNYMDYTDDACMNIYTNNQKTRILTVMNNSPRRLELKTSTKDLPITLFANDAEVIIENSCSGSVAPTCANPNPSSANKVISLYNRGTSNLTAAVISYNMNGGTTYTYNFTGNLAPNKFAYITLTNTDVSGTLNTTITSANGTTDQRASNNTASKTFGAGGGGGIPDHPYTTFTFDLIGDPWGDEVTWDLKNSSGTTVYSGRPYTFTGVPGTQVLESNMTWTLNTLDCYTFTIYDGYGDGMAGSGNGDVGSWTIKTNSGAITVASGGGNYGDEESASFTNASLTSNNFGLDAIAVYPNPTNDILNISIPSILGNDTMYEVYNSLGQTIIKNQVSQNEFTISTSNIASGIYFLKLNVDGASKVIRFVRK